MSFVTLWQTQITKWTNLICNCCFKFTNFKVCENLRRQTKIRRHPRQEGGLTDVTSCHKNRAKVKKIMEFVWRNLWTAPYLSCDNRSCVCMWGTDDSHCALIIMYYFAFRFILCMFRNIVTTIYYCICRCLDFMNSLFHLPT